MMDYLAHVGTVLAIYTLLVQGLNIAMGLTGIVSVMQASFFGVGAYVSASLAIQTGLPVPLCLIGAIAGASLAGFAVGMVLAPLRGDYLALATFGVALIASDLFRNLIAITGGPMGLPGIPDPLTSAGAWLLAATSLAALGIWLAMRIERSPFGRLLQAVRDDEGLAIVMGRDTRRVKATALAVAAAFAGAAGSLYAHYIKFIDPTSFAVMESVNLITMLVIGGMGNAIGPVIGASFIILLGEGLRFVGLPSAVVGPLRQALIGLLLVLVISLRPRGLAGRYEFAIRC